MEPLSQFQIIEICNKDPILKKYFRGVFERGKYLNRSTVLTPGFIIQNNDFRGEEGRHWLLIYYDNKKTYFFDSFGFSPELYGFNAILEREGLPVVRNCKIIQLYSSAACGYHTLIVALLLSMKKLFHDILFNFYSENLTLNDSRAYNIIKNRVWKHCQMAL